MTDLLDIYKACQAILPPDVDIFASQEGEDILIKRLLKRLYFRSGFYVDVGAHHPIRFSTTLHYYMRGWRGINIEPLGEALELFERMRPNDINIKSAVGMPAASMTYYKFKEPAFNTVSAEQARYAQSKTELIGEEHITVEPLAAILDKHLPKSAHDTFHFLNIDVEGFEASVLRSNDWRRYRPRLVLVEALTETAVQEVSELLGQQQYFFVARTKNTYFFAEQQFKRDYVD